MKKILLVDNQDGRHFNNTIFLLFEGFAVKSVLNCQEGLSIYDIFLPDIIFLNLKNKDKYGGTTGQQLLKKAKEKKARAFVITDTGMAPDVNIKEFDVIEINSSTNLLNIQHLMNTTG